ncbi:MAG: 30S ribosome-binding factor RbfA [Alphaproteobacteria bacterium]|nr:30S ribosome-binding factor RbfA [Alphaproteobacteria bacterium]
MAGRHAAPAGPSQRQLRVGEEVRRVLARVFERDELHDPALYDVRITISEVTVSPDLRNATVWIMPLGDRSSPELMESLKRNAGRLSGAVAREVRLRFAPRLSFKRDTAFDTSSRIGALLHDPAVQRDLHTDEQADDQENDATPRPYEGDDGA